MYRSLYRKWRPKRFADLVGQDSIIRTLKNELKFAKIAHAYLFMGFRGTGKTTCAKVLAKAVNCLDLKDGDACCECKICKVIDEGEILDIVELDAASNNSVNDVRALCENSNFTPAQVKYRVYIIDEVHMLSSGAFAALLKTLEEPPSHVIFILATTESYKLPATILSRCQRFEFLKIQPEVIAQKLLDVSSCENLKLTRKAAFLIAKYSDGALRDALSLLDKFVFFTQEITEEIVKEVLGISSRDYVYAMAFSLVKGDFFDVINRVFKLNSLSKDTRRLCEELIFFFRDIMIAKVSGNFSELLVLTKEEKKEVEKISSVLNLDKIIFILDSLQNCLKNMILNTNDRIEFELTLVKICKKMVGDSDFCLCKGEDDSVGINKKIDNPNNIFVKKNSTKNNLKTNELNGENNEENTGNIKMIAAESNTKKINTQNAQTNQDYSQTTIEESATKSNIDNAVLDDASDGIKQMSNWPGVLKKLKDCSKLIHMAFVDSKAYIKNDSVLIYTTKHIAHELLNNNLQKNKICSAIKEITGIDYNVLSYTNPPNPPKPIDSVKKFIKHAKNAGFKIIESD
ncbi:MAG: DNA polymerase III subunit gamma/tau [Oscillospiraceae bacterium]|jgi:DNA polymerase-3 subunit gamma/tau|nr:DNA polymerase III subunit gamma/tau [Oscillospiraceae bacterium]